MNNKTVQYLIKMGLTPRAIEQEEWEGLVQKVNTQAKLKQGGVTIDDIKMLAKRWGIARAANSA